MTTSSPNPSRFFCQLGTVELAGSSAFLDAQQAYLRESKICGFIEIQIGPATQIILLFAQGVLAGAYLMEGDESKPFQLINLSTIWNGKPTPIRTVNLPQTAGRMMWLALESPINTRSEIVGRQAFEDLLNVWKSEQISGVVDVNSENGQGIFYIQDGSPLDSESFFHSSVEFTGEAIRDRINEQDVVKILVHKLSPASQAYQCLVLRQGVLHWGTGMLSRYQELAGQKLIKMIQKDIDDITRPWDWKIFVDNSMLHDEHFFSYVQTAAQAYRAVFMEIGSQMDQVVGSALTLRVLSDTFSALSKDTRSSLELHRLIPAAFSA